MIDLSCASPDLAGLPALAAASSGQRPSAFAQLVDAYFEAMFAFWPTSATAMGLHAHDRALEDPSAARTSMARIAEVRGFVARLDRARAGGHPLRPTRRIDRAFLQRRRRAPSSSISRRSQTWRRNPMGYARLPGEADRRPHEARLRAIGRTACARSSRACASSRASSRRRAPTWRTPAPGAHRSLALRMTKGSDRVLRQRDPRREHTKR